MASLHDCVLQFRPFSCTAQQAINTHSVTVLIVNLCTYIERQLSNVTVEHMTLTGTCFGVTVDNTGPVAVT